MSNQFLKVVKDVRHNRVLTQNDEKSERSVDVFSKIGSNRLCEAVILKLFRHTNCVVSLFEKAQLVCCTLIAEFSVVVSSCAPEAEIFE